MDLLQMLQDDEITVTGRANSMPLFFSVLYIFFFQNVTVLHKSTHAPLFVCMHLFMCL